ncbi:MAG TPA: mechanosensitive ion channel family protein, partial [Thermoanaerobaculia bacterium]|nr:mechanosensitive ion channel family protein [Thermoanaerobaculia bacterium]
PRVRFRRFGESSLEIELLCWIEMPALRGLVEHELNCAIYKEFQRRGILIPFPQRDVHLIPTGAAGMSQEAPGAEGEPAADSAESAAGSRAGWAPASAADPAAGGGGASR